MALGFLGDAWDSFKDWWGGPGGKVGPIDTGYAPGINQGYEQARGLGTPQLGAASTAVDSPFRNQQGQLAGMLMSRARGQGLVSSVEANQGAERAVAAQQAMAASAPPGAGPMAQRLMMQGAGDQMSALTGTRALAGAQEAAGAAGMAGGVLQGARGLDQANSQFNASAMNQRAMEQAQLEMMKRGQNLQALGQQGSFNTGLSGLQLQRDLGVAGMPTGWDRMMQLGSTAGGMAMMMSDRRAKKDVEPAGSAADEFVKALKPRRYRYKSEKHGAGVHVGVMAQDIEKTSAGRRAVIETPEGKMVNYSALAPVFAAALGRMNQRLERVERR